MIRRYVLPLLAVAGVLFALHMVGLANKAAPVAPPVVEPAPVPYIVPKRSLTGDSTERVDTRVLQILYSFERGAIPVYVGQQMDVFIAAPSVDSHTIMPDRVAASPLVGHGKP